jgi:hypothetical protein
VPTFGANFFPPPLQPNRVLAVAFSLRLGDEPLHVSPVKIPDPYVPKPWQQVIFQMLRVVFVRRALDVVTSGLNPNSKMKHSGIQWLGRIPAHWAVCRAKVLFKEINDLSTTGEGEHWRPLPQKQIGAE